MSNIKIETDKLKPCHCGGIPQYYSIAYGNRPYIVSCPLCSNRNYPGMQSEKEVINYWNTKARLTTYKS